MVTIFNPTDREVEIRLFDGSQCVFLDNACKDVSESVAKLAIQEFPQLQIISGSVTLEGEEEPAEVVEQKIEAEIEGEPKPDGVFIEQPDGKIKTFSKEDLDVIGLDQAETYYYCSYPGCQLKFDGPAIMREHLARHDKKDRVAIAEKVEKKEKGKKDKLYAKGQEPKEGNEEAVKEGQEEIVVI